MKKLKLLFTLVLSGLCLTGCGPEKGDLLFGNNLEVVCKHRENKGLLYFLKDKDTDNIYMYISDYNQAGLTPYYNSKGEVMNYSEFKQVHKHD